MAVARVKRSATREVALRGYRTPDYAALHPGYDFANDALNSAG